MYLLPNGCRCSNLTVFPKDWKTVKSCTKDLWYITYRFYDPNITDSHGKIKPKQVMIKGMNVTKDRVERKIITQQLLDNEWELLYEKGYNPITKVCSFIDTTVYEIDPQTPFFKALELALIRIKCEDATRKDMKSVLKYISIAGTQLNYQNLPISQVKKKHIRQILDYCEKVKTVWNANRYNHYRKYLSILFRELCELDAVEYNPVQYISKQKTISKIRETLSMEERKKVDLHLKAKHPTFWRFTQIFFHSGARITELLRIKVKDVDLIGQRYKCVIKKGKDVREVWKTIKTIALPFWSEIITNANPEEFVFSNGLTAGMNNITAPQITRRWEMHVKKRLGITADFYSLKHLNTGEVVDALNDQDAAALNSHTSTAMVVKIYDTKNKDRQHTRLKNVNNKFA